jgi:hypothetical protein
VTDPVDLPYKTVQAKRAKSLILGPLADCDWWTIRKLTDHVLCERLHAFVGLDRGSARQAVRRSVIHIGSLGFAETKRTPGARGLMDTHVRRVLTAEEIETERRQLMDEVAIECGYIESDD